MTHDLLNLQAVRPISKSSVDSSVVSTPAPTVYIDLAVSVDYKAAIDWYHKTARQSHARAQTSIGDLYANGQGVPQNYVKSLGMVTPGCSTGLEGFELARIDGFLSRLRDAISNSLDIKHLMDETSLRVADIIRQERDGRVVNKEALEVEKVTPEIICYL